MLLHSQRQRLYARENQESIERRQRWTEIAQAKYPAGDCKRKIAKCLLNLDAVIFRARLAQHRVFVVFRPVEGAGIDDNAAKRIAVSAEKFGQRMHDNVRPVVDRAYQIRRRQSVSTISGTPALRATDEIASM